MASHRICVSIRWRLCLLDLNGLQVAGWGSETNTFAPLSQARMRYWQILRVFMRPIRQSKIGLKLMIDPISGKPERSVSLPSLYIKEGLAGKHQRQLCESVRRRNGYLRLSFCKQKTGILSFLLFQKSHTSDSHCFAAF